MTQEIYILEVELEDRFEEVELLLGYTWENTGIGAYEWHGVRGIDRGYDYKELHTATYDQSLYTKAEIEIIEQALETNWETIQININD